MNQSWTKLDNAGKLFDSIANVNNSSVFRISATLDHRIDYMILQKVLDKVLIKFPSFAVCIKKGFFWSYFEKNTKPFIIERENVDVCSDFNRNSNNGYLIRVLYYHDKITLEVFHSVSDGAGALEFFKGLLINYLKAFYMNKKMLNETEIIPNNDLSDSFKMYANEDNEELSHNRSAYQLLGKRLKRNEKQIIHGSLDLEEIKKCAKKYDVSITVLLTSILIYSIYHTSKKKVSRPIVISVPVNLRGVFPSLSLKNFFTVVGVKMYPNNITCMADIINDIKRQLDNQLSKRNLQYLINKNVQLESKYYAKLTPLIIKNYVLKLGFSRLSESQKTMNLSNLGQFQLPQSFEEHVESINVVSYPTKQTPINCSVISYNGNINISFIKNIEDTEMISCFFTYLSKEEGIIAEIKSNMND